MRLVFLKVFAWVSIVFFGSMAFSQTADDADIQLTIQSQVEAFLEDDFDAAFAFASPMIQGMFGSAERFGAMVRNGYPMVWRPADVEYLDLRDERGTKVQRVRMRDAQGREHYLDYQMIRGSDGWRINGVTLVPAPGLAA